MIGNILGIASVLIGIVALIISVVLYKRRRKYPGQIGFYILDAVRLTNPLFDKTKNIKLTYENREIEHGVSYVQALFCNIGDEDINLDSSSSEGGICIKLPEQIKWLDIQLKHKSESLQVSLSKDANNDSIMHVNGGLFKRDEIFTFEAFVEGEFHKNKYSNLSVHHRIQNTAPIQVDEMFYMQKKRKRRYFYRTYAFISVFAFLFVGISMYVLLNDKPINFVERGTNNVDNVFSAHVYTKDSIIVTRFDGVVWPWTDDKYSITEFNDKYEISTYTSAKHYWLIMSASILYGVVIIILLVGLFILKIKDKNKRNVEKIYLQMITNDNP